MFQKNITLNYIMKQIFANLVTFLANQISKRKKIEKKTSELLERIIYVVFKFVFYVLIRKFF